ncbi:MAG TPA: ATP-dependent Clp protease ATP-binding subunit [bacterium]|nr:ATP-dependent Clp protease ATP-binding subunit [bacterium]
MQENIKNIFGKFSKKLKNVLVRAQDLAITLNQSEINIWEIFYELSNEKGCIAEQIIKDFDIKSEDLKLEVTKLGVESVLGKENKKIPIFSEECQKIIEKSVNIAYQYKHKYIGTEHLLCAIIKSENDEINKYLQKLKIDKEELLKTIEGVLISTNKFAEIIDDSLSNFNIVEKMMLGAGAVNDPNPVQFTVELTSESVQQKIDPVIGREKEIDRLIQILCRRTKNNPILLGEPGVGKTAIVEGLAKKILNADVPDVLLNKKIIAIDLGAIISGTMYRGEFEKRLKKIIDDAKNDDDMILFIDEIHALVGMGASGGQLDAANMLKPELAKGDLKVIGATTVIEYKKYIESDPAFERRFQPILIDEPDNKEAEKIIMGLRDHYEKYHNVKITDSAIKSAISLSQRYLPEKFLPDKAIDLIDEASSKFKVKNSKDINVKKIFELKNSLSVAIKEKEKAISEDDYERAIIFQQNEDKILEELNKLKEAEKEVESLGEITEKNIAEIISRALNIPVEDLLESEKSKLVNLENLISKKIIGQDEIVNSVCQYIKKSKAGLSNPNKPLASFIFLGPSGVGKTEMAKVLARDIYGDERSLIRVDMSEFSEKFDISKLIGSPAGYVGYKDSNKFTDSVRIKPYSIILFDEIEKAHPDIFNLLLPILDEGYLIDAVGRMINFKNTVIIMTSNIGNDQFNRQASIGFDLESDTKKEFLTEEFEHLEKKIVDSLDDYFNPEFINRIDKILVFKSLDIGAMADIAKLQMKELIDRMKDRGINLIVKSSVYKFIAKNSFNPQMGARPMRRFISDKIENNIANQILADKIRGGDSIYVDILNNEITIAKL